MQNAGLSLINYTYVNGRNAETANLKSDKEIPKENKEKNGKMLKLALTGLAIVGAAAATGFAIYMGKNKILQNAGGNVTEQAVEGMRRAIQKNEPQIPVVKKLSEIDFKNIPKETFTVEDLLSNCDKIQLEYTDGVLTKSRRSGHVNFEKTYEILEDGRHKVTKTSFGKSVSVILEDTQNAVKKSQNEIRELLSKKDKLPLSEFREQSNSIQYKTKEQKAELTRIMSEKTQAETLRKADFLSQRISNWNGKNDEYIKEIMSYNDEQFEIVEILLNSKTRGIGDYYGKNPENLIRTPHRYDAESLGSIKDKARLQKILQIVLKDKGVKLEDAIELSKYDGVMFERASVLTDRGCSGFATRDYYTELLKSLDEKQFGRMLDLIDKGYGVIQPELLACAKLDDKSFERAVTLCDKYGFNNDILKSVNLSDEQFQKLLEKLEAGVSNGQAGKLSDEQFANFKYLLAEGVDRDAIAYSELSDRVACEEFLQKYKSRLLSSGVNAKEVTDCEAHNWLTEYIGGSPVCSKGSYADVCLEKTCSQYQIAENGQQLGRWMRRDDLHAFIQNFPEVGETYVPGRIQSFAKTLEGAERYSGNNFSDLNTSLNVKMVVTPKAKLTQAFDTGMGKYGADEAVYRSTQKFEVLKKGFEIVTNPDGYKHRQYVIYLKEL